MNGKKVVLGLLVLFLGFWMFQDPHGFAVSAKSAGAGSWDALTVVFRGVIRFIGEMS
ncbi:hypothetical protein ACT8ZV_04450 [Nocardioides sp. MAHUQ-72]|uniref:hypothetical protein n=1 Tax=unclassified Nocardioides TaxID=2615069 RepID=UPI00360FC314